MKIKSIAKRVLDLPKSAFFDNLHPGKKELIEYACQRLGMKSFADLGAVWNVDGGYAFYAMEKYGIPGTLDWVVTPAVLEGQKKHPSLNIVHGNFGTQKVAAQVRADGVFFFDTLLHQVKPNWAEILRMYSAARIILIFNPQFTSFKKSTRLLDLGLSQHSAHYRRGTVQNLLSGSRCHRREIRPALPGQLRYLAMGHY